MYQAPLASLELSSHGVHADACTPMNMASHFLCKYEKGIDLGEQQSEDAHLVKR